MLRYTRNDNLKDIARLRQMLSSLAKDPKRNETDKDLVEYRNRVEYLDTALTRLEVEAAPLPMSMIPPSIVYYDIYDYRMVILHQLLRDLVDLEVVPFLKLVPSKPMLLPLVDVFLRRLRLQ